MSTNAKLSNFVSQEIYSRSREENERVWCYLLFKLSPILNSYIIKRKAEVFKIYDKSRFNHEIIENLKSFAECDRSIISKERPLFIIYIFDFLMNMGFIETVLELSHNVFDIKIYFQMLLNHIFERFTQRKKNLIYLI